MAIKQKKLLPEISLSNKEYWSIRNQWIALYKEPSTLSNEFGEDILLSEISLQEKLYADATKVFPLCTKDHNITGSIINIHNVALADVTKIMYKAFAVSRSIARDMGNCQFTYSEVSSYIASLFFAKAIALMLGIWTSPDPIATTQSKKTMKLYWAIDFFRKNESKNEYNTYLVNLEKQKTGHSNFWETFIYLIDELSLTNNKGEFFKKLKTANINPKKIPSIRNKIQYSYGYWGDNDLTTDEELSIDWFEDYLQPSETIKIYFDDISTHPNKIFLLELMNIAVSFYSDIAVFDSLKQHSINFQDQKQQLLKWQGQD